MSIRKVDQSTQFAAKGYNCPHFFISGSVFPVNIIAKEFVYAKTFARTAIDHKQFYLMGICVNDKEEPLFFGNSFVL
jgi:hypothetical protein